MHVRNLCLAAFLVLSPVLTAATAAYAHPAAASDQARAQTRKPRLGLKLMLLWRQQHPGQNFRNAWTALSPAEQQKLASDLSAQWDALPSDQRNAIQQQIQNRRERRRNRRDGGAASDSTAQNPVSSMAADSMPSGETTMPMTAMPVSLVTAIVTILALLFYFWTGWQVGVMRGKHGIKAPAMVGHLQFESAVRVQMNTLEWVVIFIPMLWLATIYFSPAMNIVWLSWLPPVFGVIWIIGRFLYMTGYMQAPEKRGPGFGIAGFAVIGLLIMAIIGIVMQWTAVNAA